MKKKSFYPWFFIFFFLTLYAALFFVYGGIKLKNLDFAGEAIPESLYPLIESEIVWNNKQFLKYLYIKNKERSYMGYVDAQIKSQNLPKDLRYIPYVESSLQLDAVSDTRGAVGIWQLTPGVAQKFDVTIDINNDERKDIKISTSVALEHLISQYDVFGSWLLAVAAYNSGEQTVATALAGVEDKNYFSIKEQMDVPDYMIKILAYKYGK